MTGQRNPDIQRLLANLRAGSLIQSDNSQPQNIEGHPNSGPVLQQRSYGDASSIPGLGFLQPDGSRKRPLAISNPSTPQPKPLPTTQIQPNASQDRPSTPVVAPPDSSVITTWPAALKYVTKHVTTNEKTVAKIKLLIAEQHKHERQWWTGREAILIRHSGRVDNQTRVTDLLKSLGGASVPVAVRDPKEDQAELTAYDRKVYKSLSDMAADFDRQLRALGVPFFAMKHDLVILEEGSQKEGAVKGRIDRGELRELQRRMAEMLEDLLGDD